MSTLQETTSRFSPMQYLSSLRQEEPRSSSRFHHPEAVSHIRQEFDQTVDLMRGVLIGAQGSGEHEQMEYNRILNEAVLGLTEGRRRILAFLQDELAKRGLLHVRDPSGSYDSLAEAVYAELIGMHVLELVMKDRSGLEEIQVVGTRIYEVRQGQPVLSKHRFRTVQDVLRIQQNLVLYNNEVFHPRKRWAEVMLADGTRVTLTGFGYTSEPTMTLRFFPVKRFELSHLCESVYETLEPRLVDMLRLLLRSYVNIVVIGATNSGKTHLMKCMIAEMPEQERIVTIESRLELMLKRDFPERNIIEYEIDERDREHSADQAFSLALRQSPKRIVHAEIRDEDANIYVRACTRGHEGSMTTVHVNALEDVPDAITDMCMLDRRGMNPDRLRRRIVEYVARVGLEMALVDGKRKLVRMVEYEFHGDELTVRDIVRYDPVARLWRYEHAFSPPTLSRFVRYDLAGYTRLMESGGAAP